ncbi:DNA cytosine methyltransferase [Shewanella sp. GXUN23E]|uniref:DNA cytosine methyltransferase n=1 Tax=Shewanella sp. GXUN23E TaxID=3422498 RepID=UPI003D7EAC3E
MLTFIDLFCGGGFGARGAVNAGGKPLLAVDYWDLAAQNYQANFPDAEVLAAKIEDVDPIEYAAKYKPDVLLTSPECTSHSIARGAKPGCEKSRETALGIQPWINALKPRWVIVENVPRMKKWEKHDQLVADIEQAGYAVSPLVLNAADFGAPQSRLRMFLVCSKNQHVFTRDELFEEFGSKKAAAKSFIDFSGKYKSTPLYTEKRAKATLERAERGISALGKGVNFLIVYYSTDYAGGWQRIDEPLRTITTVDRFGLVTWKEDIPYLRMLQPEELKLAMGATKRHQLAVGNRRDKVKMCGNGVCSTVIETLFNKIKSIEYSTLDKVS